jgi:hypothetical protein
MTFDEKHENSCLDERCKDLGIKTYDTAMPQGWFDRVIKHLDFNPCGHVVWCYDNCTFGYPLGVTPKGRYIVGFMAQMEIK